MHFKRISNTYSYIFRSSSHSPSNFDKIRLENTPLPIILLLLSTGLKISFAYFFDIFDINLCLNSAWILSFIFYNRAYLSGLSLQGSFTVFYATLTVYSITGCYSSCFLGDYFLGWNLGGDLLFLTLTGSAGALPIIFIIVKNKLT